MAIRKTAVILCRNGCRRIVKKNATKYCSQTCHKYYQYAEFISRWKCGEVNGTTTSFDIPSMHIRRYLIETYGAKCWICGWAEINPRTRRVPIHLDHVDGNARNNTEANLRLLCPNHHSLTETYGKSNVGKGRPGRRARYQRHMSIVNLVTDLATGGSGNEGR